MSCDFLPRLLALLGQDRGKAGVLLSGRLGAGKTSCAERLASTLKRRGISVGGVVQPRFVQSGETLGYTVRDLATGGERSFASLRPPGIVVGKYFIKEEGVRFARCAVERAAKESRVVFVDEVGRLELSGGGHASAVRMALDSQAFVILVTRTEFVDDVVEAFSLEGFSELALERGRFDD